jgi:hypothetical protein
LGEQKNAISLAIEQALFCLSEQAEALVHTCHDRSCEFNGTIIKWTWSATSSIDGSLLKLLEDFVYSPEVKARGHSLFARSFPTNIPEFGRDETFLLVLNRTNNWNSVCLAGVTGAALALLQDKEERAYFIAAAEKYNIYGMRGYGDDGYCSEGVGYYNYGFRAYILLREEVCRATQGQIDFFRNPNLSRFLNMEKIQKLIEYVPLILIVA